MSEANESQKRALRAEIRERRRTLTERQRRQWSSELTQQLIALVRETGAQFVSCYLSTTDEPGTTEFLGWAERSGIRVLLPISREDGLLDWVESNGSTTKPGLFNIPEPDGALLSPLAVNEVDLMLIPACAIDAHGNRLGWGRGYFDRTLGSMDARPPVFAVVFETELIDEVPTDHHDQRVDGVVTPERILRFS